MKMKIFWLFFIVSNLAWGAYAQNTAENGTASNSNSDNAAPVLEKETGPHVLIRGYRRVPREQSLAACKGKAQGDACEVVIASTVKSQKVKPADITLRGACAYTWNKKELSCKLGSQESLAQEQPVSNSPEKPESKG